MPSFIPRLFSKPTPLVRVLSITPLAGAQARGVRFHLEKPRARDTSGTHAVHLSGWAFAGGKVVEVQLVEQGALGPLCDFVRVPVNLPRRNVQKAHPDAPPDCGFSSVFTFAAGGAGGRTLTATLLALLEDKTQVPLAEMRVELGPLGSYRTEIQPLMVTTLGRSGSMWLMTLLGRHPAVVAYEPYEKEARLGSYWASFFDAFAQPGRYLQAVIPDDMARDDWWLSDKLQAGFEMPEAEPFRFMAHEGVDALADFCLAQTDRFYRHLATTQRRESPRYFAEKYTTGRIRGVVRDLFPGAREIVLVRDLRDTICSVLAFNAQRGYASFGRESVASDLEYVRWFRGPVNTILNLLQTPGLSTHLVRYEDLITQPQETLRKILAFLELEHSDKTLSAMMARFQDAPHAAHRTSKTPQESVGRWRTTLSVEMRQACRVYLDDALIALGYDPTPADG